MKPAQPVPRMRSLGRGSEDLGDVAVRGGLVEEREEEEVEGVG